MTPLFLELPDVEAAAGLILRDANVAEGRVYSSIPTNPTYPLVTYQRTGGTPAEKHKLDRASIQVDAWARLPREAPAGGAGKGEARDLAELARRVLHEAGALGTFVADFECQVTEVEDELGLRWLPDPTSKRDRYLFSVRIFAHNRVS